MLQTNAEFGPQGRRPRSGWTARVGLSCLLVLATAGACRSTDARADLADRVSETIEQGSRRATLLALVEQRTRAEVEFAREWAELVERLRAANADPASTSADLRAIASQFEDASRDYRAVVLDVAAGMRSVTTAEEWAQIAESDLRAILDANPRIQEGQ